MFFLTKIISFVARYKVKQFTTPRWDVKRKKSCYSAKMLTLWFLILIKRNVSLFLVLSFSFFYFFERYVFSNSQINNLTKGLFPRNWGNSQNSKKQLAWSFTLKKRQTQIRLFKQENFVILKKRRLLTLTCGQSAFESITASSGDPVKLTQCDGNVAC